MFKLRNPNQSRLANARLGMFMQRLRESLTESADLSTLRQKMAELFKQFFQSGGTTNIDLDRVLLSKTALPSVREWNELMDMIENDITAGFQELEALNEMAVAASNMGSVLVNDLRERVSVAASKVIDVRLKSGQLNEQLIVAGDDFNDLSLVDVNFALQNPQAQVITGQGAVTLARAEALNLINPDNVQVQVKPLNQNITTGPTPDNTNRFYEGNFFDFLGKARPEGGQFHLEEKAKPGVARQGDGGIRVLDLEQGGFFDQVGDLRRLNEDVNRDGLPYKPEDILVIDRGATQEEKAEQRRKMLDGNPDTFWECEVVQRAEELSRLARGNPIEGTNGNPDDRYFIQEYAKGAIDALLPNSAQPSSSNVLREPEPLDDPATPDTLRAKAASAEIDRFDLEIEIQLRLPSPQPLNFLTLNPYNFDETAWLEVFEISTSPDESSAFELIEGFATNQFENTLTDEANEELSPEEAKVVLSPNRYAYRGQGFWSFPVRTVRLIKFKIRQRTPVPNPYQRVIVQLRRQLTKTVSK